MKARTVAGLLLLVGLGGGLWWLVRASAAAGDADATLAAAAGGGAGLGGGTGPGGAVPGAAPGANGAAGSGTPGAGPTDAPAFAGPQTCLPCHAAVVAEWRDSMHSRAFTDPQVRAPDQSDNFQKQECLPCHASRPIFEHGIEKDSRVLARVERRVDGVDCLACHALPEGGVAATRSGLTAACRPVLRTELSTEQMCAACHNQHNTHDEWRVSPAAAAGKDCLDCHMARVTRDGGEAGAPRGGRSHRFPGGRDRDFALEGITVTPRLVGDERRLEVSLENAFAGHNLPADSRNRALDLVVTLRDGRGAALPGPADEKREPGCETGTARRRLRNPYRASGDPNTQLPAGQTALLDVSLPDTAATADVELFYKLSPWIKDTEAHWSWKQTVPLR